MYGNQIKGQDLRKRSGNNLNIQSELFKRNLVKYVEKQKLTIILRPII